MKDYHLPPCYDGGHVMRRFFGVCVKCGAKRTPGPSEPFEA